MQIWILAVLLVAALVYVGYAQGAIRVAFSFLGILVAWLLAVPLSVKVAPLFEKMGMLEPGLPVLLGGVLVFIVVSALFKAAALVVHRKFDNFYKYRVSDTRLLLWERMNKRTGACLGIANAILYLILISGVIYGFGYWTVQMARPEGDPFTLRMLNGAARGLSSSGFVKTAGAVMPVDESFYDSADLAGLLYNNPSTSRRLERYPAFLSFAERPEFAAIINSDEIGSMRRNGESLARFLANPLIHHIVTNRALRGELETVLSRDLKDLTEYIKTGKSPKYDEEKILGHWRFSVNGTLEQTKAALPKINSQEMATLRLRWRLNLMQIEVVVAPDGQVFVKGVPVSDPNAVPGVAPELRTVNGQWEEAAGGYRMTMEGELGEMRAFLRDGRLVLVQSTQIMAFDREL